MSHKGRETQKSLSDPETWVDKYGDSLYRFALSRTGDPGLAEDLVQETFLAALQARDNFEGRSLEKTWLISILKHKIIDYIRRKSREKPSADLDNFAENSDEFFDESGSWLAEPAGWKSKTDELYEQTEFWKVLQSCLSKLSARLADLFILREIQGRSTSEICKELQISTTNCWVMLHRARLHLRRCLEENWLLKD